MLEIRNLEGFRRQVDAAVKKKAAEVGPILMKVMKDAQAHATNISPVYSGDFASNWNVNVGSADGTFRATTDYLGPEYPEPKTMPWGMGAFDFSGFTPGKTIYLSNSAEHDEPYAFLIEDNKITFRAVNQGRDAVRAKTAEHIKNKWGFGK